MTAIIDYGVGNLFSLSSSFAKIGADDTVITSDADVIRKSDRIVLPGVGAFGDAAKKLFESGLADVVKEEAKSGKPILGICLGMQLMFDKSYEYGEHDGLGLIRGSIVPIPDKGLKIPHMGWNGLKFKEGREKSRIFKYINEGDHVYFVHSYYADDCDESITATSEYGIDITASCESGNVFALQFHPEKSGNVGLNILKAFVEMKK